MSWGTSFFLFCLFALITLAAVGTATYFYKTYEDDKKKTNLVLAIVFAVTSVGALVFAFIQLNNLLNIFNQVPVISEVFHYKGWLLLISVLFLGTVAVAIPTVWTRQTSYIVGASVTLFLTVVTMTYLTWRMMNVKKDLQSYTVENPLPGRKLFTESLSPIPELRSYSRPVSPSLLTLP